MRNGKNPRRPPEPYSPAWFCLMFVGNMLGALLACALVKLLRI